MQKRRLNKFTKQCENLLEIRMSRKSKITFGQKMLTDERDKPHTRKNISHPK